MTCRLHAGFLEAHGVNSLSALRKKLQRAEPPGDAHAGVGSVTDDETWGDACTLDAGAGGSCWCWGAARPGQPAGEGGKFSIKVRGSRGFRCGRGEEIDATRGPRGLAGAREGQGGRRTRPDVAGSGRLHAPPRSANTQDSGEPAAQPAAAWQLYLGGFESGARSGFGVTVTSAGEAYAGSWRSDAVCGWGVHAFSSPEGGPGATSSPAPRWRREYVGAFKGRPWGLGRMRWQDGRQVRFGTRGERRWVWPGRGAWDQRASRGRARLRGVRAVAVARGCSGTQSLHPPRPRQGAVPSLARRGCPARRRPRRRSGAGLTASSARSIWRKLPSGRTWRWGSRQPRGRRRWHGGCGPEARPVRRPGWSERHRTCPAPWADAWAAESNDVAATIPRLTSSSGCRDMLPQKLNWVWRHRQWEWN